MNITIHAKDSHITRDFSNLNPKDKDYINGLTYCGPKKTKIILKDHDTGEILGEYENKVVISGSQFSASHIFGIDGAIDFRSYNDEMELDNRVSDDTEPLNVPKVCLFCVSDSGCGTEPKDVIVTKNTDRIKPAPDDNIVPVTDTSVFESNMIMPFRWVDVNDDLNSDLRKYYFGRKTYPSLNKIGYYFKTFDTVPQMHINYADGTEVIDPFSDESTQIAECYVETRLRITRLDFRDYFQDVLGWDKARISSLSLLSGWTNEVGGYTYYQNVLPYTILNFSYRPLADLTVAIDIIYAVYY